MSELDGAKPFDGEKTTEARRGSRQRTERETKDGEKLPEIRETEAVYRCGSKDAEEAAVRSWNSVKLRAGRIAQPWHERLSRIRDRQDPRF
ncbi:hypothetical protein [Saccharibacillus alkalitolerans]|uniref:Transposase n=1 Tax=Saccharibacillus alkalitolerans TaxID=2705290 RepID=A0ABX0FDV9_9BACL|nr:hypothetical protein [Saccharibacillus alkalitolerans]NGZ77891.1 hypothetical protein [Saccharibacillus alkalitolerans]